MSTNGTGVPLDFDREPTDASAQKIRTIEQVPNIRTMKIPPIDYIVPGLFARGTVTLWAGEGGVAKSFLAQNMAIAVATGGKFLGRTCQQAPVLYLDYENPAFAVQQRLDLMAGDRPTPNLRVWGTAYLGDFSQMAIAVRTDFRVEATRIESDAFKNLQVAVRIYGRFDVAVMRPTAFVVLTNVGS